MPDKPTQFYRSTETNQDATKETKPFPTRRVVTWMVSLIIAIVVLLEVVFQLTGVYKRVSSRWSEIMFAYNKPAIVRSMRVDYEAQQKKLETSFVDRQTKDTTQQQFLQAVTSELKPSK